MKKVFVVALKEEVNNLSNIFDIPVIISGVGKINAAITAGKLKYKGIKHIINIGSCGSFKHNIGDVLKIGSIYQDIDATPLVEYSHTPGEKNNNIIISESKTSCFTTDTFICKTKKFSGSFTNFIDKTDIFDMEAFSFAKACVELNMEFSCYKWVSDNGSGGDWEENKDIGFKNFKLKYEKIPNSL